MKFLRKLFFSNKARIDLLNDMEDLLREGTSILEIGEDFVEFGSGVAKDIGQGMLDQVGNGRPVAFAFSGYMSDIVVQTLLAGEQAENLADGCKNAITAIKNTSGVAGKLASALAPPMIQFGLIFTVVIALSNNIFPILEDLVPIFMWPSFSRTYYEFVMDVAENWKTYVGIAVVFPYICVQILRNVTGVVRQALDKLPMFVQYRYVISSQIMFTMSTLLKNGDSLADVLEFCGKHASRYQAWKVAEIKTRMEESKSASIGYLMDVELLHERQLNRLQLTGGLGSDNDHRLRRSAVAHTDMLDKQIQAIASLTKVLVLASAVVLMLMLLGSIIMLVLQMRSAM